MSVSTTELGPDPENYNLYPDGIRIRREERTVYDDPSTSTEDGQRHSHTHTGPHS